MIDQKLLAEKKKHLVRLDECQHRRDTPPMGSCRLITEKAGWLAGIGMDTCDECWRKGPGTPEAESFRSGIVSQAVAAVLKSPCGRAPLSVILTIAGKHVPLDKGKELIRESALRGGKEVIAVAEKLEPGFGAEINAIQQNATPEDRLAAMDPSARWAEVREDWEDRDEDVEQWSLAQKAGYLAEAIISGWLKPGSPEDDEVYDARHGSCFGSATETPCRSLATRPDGLHYCADCGCGPKDIATLDHPSKPKLRRRKLRCPRRRRGFTNALVPLQVSASKKLVTTFDRVVLINLDRRPDRLERFNKDFAKIEEGWPFLVPVRFPAIDGRLSPTPHGWRAGSGAWGCMQSHRQVLEQAILAGAQSILVLEDDASFNSDFLERLDRFMKDVPADWDGLMLGGQHIRPANPIKPGVVKCLNTQRTHAYAVRGKYMRDLFQQWSSRAGHCDHIMGPLHAAYNIYAPDPFIVMQDAGPSDISGNNDHRRSWSSNGEVKLVVASCTPTPPVDLLKKFKEDNFHVGYWLTETGLDRGINEAFTKPVHNVTALVRTWWQYVKNETAALDGGVAFLVHPNADKFRKEIEAAVAPMKPLYVELTDSLSPDKVRDLL